MLNFSENKVARVFLPMGELGKYQGRPMRPPLKPDVWPDVPGEFHEFQYKQCVLRVLWGAAISSMATEGEEEDGQLARELVESLYEELDPVIDTAEKS